MDIHKNARLSFRSRESLARFVIEQGATWMPGFMRSIDSAADAFRKNEERLQKLELKPSEYVQRQVRVTPYPHEDAGWVIQQTGPDVCLFSSDYPAASVCPAILSLTAPGSVRHRSAASCAVPGSADGAT